jgi:hypothetical protein
METDPVSETFFWLLIQDNGRSWSDTTSCLVHNATSKKVKGWIPDEKTLLFNWLNPSSHIIVLV